MEMLYELCRQVAVSGNEHNLAEYLRNSFASFCDETIIDNIGNLIVTLNKNAGKRIMIEAHMDEIGLIVKRIDEKGFIKFAPIGGIDSAILPSMEVIVHGKKPVFGVIGAKPPHLMTKDEADKKYSLESLYIDTGYSFEELSAIVEIGDIITFNSEPKKLLNNRFSSKSIDNRMGICVVYECLKRLKEENIDVEITGLCAVQEEVGCRGAKVGGYNVSPDLAIVIDVTHGISPYINEEMGFPLDSGVAIGIGPNLSPEYTEKMINICKKYDLKYTLEVCNGNSGTDAWALQVSRSGIPCVLLSVPLRYMHTSVETASENDINVVIEAICAFVKEGVNNA